MRIRRAQESEARSVAELHIRSWQWAYPGQLPDAYLAGLSRSLEQRTNFWAMTATRSDQRLWLAQGSSGVVGFAATQPNSDHAGPPNAGEVGAMYLDADWAGIGVGRLLLSQAVEDLRQRGHPTVTLWVLDSNERARHFYEAAGFRADGATKVEERPGFELREIRYRRDF